MVGDVGFVQTSLSGSGYTGCVPMPQALRAVHKVRHRASGAGVGDQGRGVRLRNVERSAQQQQRRDDASHAAQQEPPTTGHGQGCHMSAQSCSCCWVLAVMRNCLQLRASFIQLALLLKA